MGTSNTEARSRYRSLDLAEQGRQKLNWVKQHMPVLQRIEERFLRERPFTNLRISLSIHLEAKTAYLAEVLMAGGAEMHVTGSNPLSTKDDVVAALVESGIYTYAVHGASQTEYEEFIELVLSCSPHFIIDDGGDLTEAVHNHLRVYTGDLVAICEETTSGVQRAKQRALDGKLNFPVLAVNDAQCKYLFDNRHGTGQSVMDGIMRTTNLSIAGKTVVVAGYGWCGKGCAQRAHGMGAKIIITEIDPIRALEAKMEGFDVMPMKHALTIADIVITATGAVNVLGESEFKHMKSETIICNAGHFDSEIDLAYLRSEALSRDELKANISTFTLANNRKIHLLGQGALVNISCADGHPAEIMDLSFAIQALAVEYASKNPLLTEVHPIPAAIDSQVAKLKLDAMGVRIH